MNSPCRREPRQNEDLAIPSSRFRRGNENSHAKCGSTKPRDQQTAPTLPPFKNHWKKERNQWLSLIIVYSSGMNWLVIGYYTERISILLRSRQVSGRLVVAYRR